MEELIIETLQALQPTFIYLFGSYVRNELTGESDIDIAFYSNLEVGQITVFLMQENLSILLNRDIDLINLRTVNTIFQAEILTTGKLIYVGNKEEQLKFELFVRKEYSYVQEARFLFVEEIKKGGQIYGRHSTK